MRHAAVILALFASGCLRGAPVGVEEQPIIGGTVDTGDPAVVVLYAQQPGANGGSLCTAEIVSAHVVLTAAHCVSPSEVGAGAQFTVFTGTDINQPTQQLAVRETHFDPQFDINNLGAGHDIAVAILANATTITPLRMNRAALTQAHVGQPVRFVGYGLSNAQTQTGAGTKRQTTTTLSGFDNVLLQFNDGVHETCNGDSGGPAFMDLGGGGEVIVGLTSFGDVNCNQGGYDTRVDKMAAFVDPYVQANDPPPVSPPDMAQPPSSQPDMGGGSGPIDPGGGDPSAGSNPQHPSSSLLPLGSACKLDEECASNACGIGDHGTLVCVGGGPGQSLFGGCAMGGGTQTETAIGLLLVCIVGLLFARGLGRRP
jgi:V8-like Glu-specific endopeptidase